MPRSKDGKKREPVDSNALKHALQAINPDDPEKKMSYREAARVFNVSRSTLKRHLNKFLECGDDDFQYSVYYSIKKVLFFNRGKLPS